MLETIDQTCEIIYLSPFTCDTKKLCCGIQNTIPDFQVFYIYAVQKIRYHGWVITSTFKKKIAFDMNCHSEIASSESSLFCIRQQEHLFRTLQVFFFFFAPALITRRSVELNETLSTKTQYNFWKTGHNA